MPAIRRAAEEDVADLVRLESDAFDDAAGTPWSETALRSLVDDDSLHLVLVAETGSPQRGTMAGDTAGDTVGYAAGYAAYRRLGLEAELLRVAVGPAHRRRGIGRSLLLRGEEILARGGVELCHLEVAADNESALHLYADLGFEQVGRRPAYYPANCNGSAAAAVDALLLRKRLVGRGRIP